MTNEDEAWEERHGNRHLCYVKRGQTTVFERIPLQHSENVEYLAGVARRLCKQLDDIDKGAIPLPLNRQRRRAQTKGIRNEQKTRSGTRGQETDIDSRG